MQLFDDLIAAHRSIRGCDSGGELFARAAELARALCGFERCVVATVVDGHLSAHGSVALADPASDLLRRRLVAAPVALQRGTEEARVVRATAQTRRHGGRSHVAEVLELREWALSPVIPELTVLALVILDRPRPPITEDERDTVHAFSTTLAFAIEHFVLRRRAAELAEELQQFAGSAQAMAREILDAPVTLPTDHGLGPALPRADLSVRGMDGTVMATLSERERRVAELLVQGRSNREIAELLVLSPETIKTHVTRLLRKVGATNRVEAVSRLLQPRE